MVLTIFPEGSIADHDLTTAHLLALRAAPFQLPGPSRATWPVSPIQTILQPAETAVLTTEFLSRYGTIKQTKALRSMAQ